MTTLAPQAMQQIAALQQAGIPIDFDVMGRPVLRSGFTPTAQQAQMLSNAGFSVPVSSVSGGPSATAAAPAYTPPSYAQWAATTAHPTQSGQTWADYWQTDQGGEHPQNDIALAAYNAATQQALSAQQAGSRTLSGIPEGFTSLGVQNADEGSGGPEFFKDASGRNFVRSMYTPTQADISSGLAKQAPDGTWYTEYGRANQTGAEHDTGNGIFFGAGPSMVDLPVTLAAGVPLAGVTGVLGGLQGLEGTSLIPGFDAAQYMNPSSVTGGGASPPANYWNMTAEGGGTLSDAAPAAAGSQGAGILSPEAGAAYGLPETTLSDTILGNVGSGGTTVGGVGLGGGLSGGGLTIPGQVLDLANTGTGATIPGTGGGGAAGGVSTPGAGSALSRIMDGTATSADYLQVLGGAGSTLLGVMGSNAQADAYNQVAQQYLNMGAPFRQTLANSYQPGFDLAAQPGYGDAFNRMADISARSYSSKLGNPADNPTAQAGILSDVWQQSYLPALSNYRGGLMQAGGLGLNTSGTASLAGAGESGGLYDSLGFGLSQLTKQSNPWEDFFKQYGQQQYKLNLGGVGP